MTAPNSLPPIESVLSHRGTMLLLDRVLHYDAQCAHAEYTPQAHAWYADHHGNMPAWFGIELMAQCIAAHSSLLKLSDAQGPKPGVLLGTRRYTSKVPSFQGGESLQIHSQMTYRDNSGLGAYECTVVARGQEVASATLKVFEPDDFQTLLQASVS